MSDLYERCSMCNGTLVTVSPAMVDLDTYKGSLNAGSSCPCRLSKTPGFVLTGLTSRQVEKVITERDRLREALTWAVGFIQCNLPRTSAEYPDMRNAQALVAAAPLHTGEFQMVVARAEVAEHERDQLRDAFEHIGIGNFRQEWFEEATALRDNSLKGNPHALQAYSQWVARTRELIQAIIDAHHAAGMKTQYEQDHKPKEGP